jgi:hypothetical protein
LQICTSPFKYIISYGINRFICQRPLIQTMITVIRTMFQRCCILIPRHIKPTYSFLTLFLHISSWPFLIFFQLKISSSFHNLITNVNIFNYFWLNVNNLISYV